MVDRYVCTFQVVTALLDRTVNSSFQHAVVLDKHLEGKATIHDTFCIKARAKKKGISRDSSAVVYCGCDSKEIIIMV